MRSVRFWMSGMSEAREASSGTVERSMRARPSSSKVMSTPRSEASVQEPPAMSQNSPVFSSASCVAPASSEYVRR